MPRSFACAPALPPGHVLPLLRTPAPGEARGVPLGPEAPPPHFGDSPSFPLPEGGDLRTLTAYVL